MTIYPGLATAGGQMGQGLAVGRGGGLNLTANLISWWTLNEASGTRNDSHGTNHLTDGNTVGSAAGKQSNAADFVAANREYLEIASNSSVQVGGTSFAYSFWFKADSIQSIGNWLVNKRLSPNNREFQIGISNAATDYLFFSIADSGGTLYTSGAAGTTPISTATWYHVIAMWNDVPKDQTLIVNNGTPVVDNRAGVSIVSGSAPLRIGQAAWEIFTSDITHDGLIDEIGFWKRTLTATEIAWLYNGGAGRTYSDL